MSIPVQQPDNRVKIYAMVSFGHKNKEGEKNSNFFVSSYTGIVDAAKVLDPDIKIEWHGPNEWAYEPEVKAIRELTARRVAGIIVTAAHKTGLDQAIQEAIQAGVPVITFDADAPASARLAFVATNNYNAGYLAGKTMAEWLQGQGDVAISTIANAEHLQYRLDGFQAAMAQFAPQSRIHVAYDSGNIDVDAEGRQDFTEYRASYLRMLNTHPEIRGLFSTYASPGAGAAEAVETLGLQGQIPILAFDYDEVIIKLVEGGKIRATVGQDSYLMGYVAMILMNAVTDMPQMPTRQAPGWQIIALQRFLAAHPSLHPTTTAKLRQIIERLSNQPAETPLAIDTGVRILGKTELLDIIASDFETMRDSIITKIEALGREIEVRKQAEQDLRKLNEELEERVQQRTAEIARQKYILDTFLANVPDTIYFKDRESRFTHVNAAFLRKFGVDNLAALLGKNDFDFFPEAEARPKYEQDQAIIQTGQPVMGLEEPDTGGTWVLTTKMPLRDERGDIIGTFGISRDITELKRAQQALQQAYSEITLLNVQLQEENLRMSAELNVSRRIQQMMLPTPRELQQIEGMEIVGFMKPADEVGGDYYDVFREHGVVHIGIGDVTGHGLESGLLMLMTQTAIRTLIEHGETDPVTFLSTLNRTLYQNIQRMNVDKMLTLAFVHYQNKVLKIIGQHEEVLVVRRDGQIEMVDTVNLGFPLGLEQNIESFVAEATVKLSSGDGIVLYTDGITEAANPAEELYGLDRLRDVVSRHWHLSAEAIKQAVVEDVLRFIGTQKMYDDLTLVIMKQE